MEGAFREYAYTFDMSDQRIVQKYNHSIRVMNLCEKYAKMLVFSDEEVYLAKVIGLLHDFGRFEQLKRFDSYSDKNIDHAVLGVNLLFDEGYIERFNIDSKYYNVIKSAILNHNTKELEIGSDEVENKLSKLIRDTDKIDIMYSLGVLRELTIFGDDDSDISKEVFDSVINYRVVDKKDLKTKNDRVAIKFGFIYDINYSLCLKEFLENIEEYYNTLEHKEKFTKLLDANRNYIKERGI